MTALLIIALAACALYWRWKAFVWKGYAEDLERVYREDMKRS